MDTFHKLFFIFMAVILCPISAFAQKFSKEGTVWAADCNLGTLIRTIARTSNGELDYFSWNSPGIKYPLKLTRFVENGDQITFSYVNINTKETTTSRVSIQNGQWRTLDSSTNGVSTSENGVNIRNGQSNLALNQCPSNSRAYLTVYPSLANQNSPANTTQRAQNNSGEVDRESDLQTAKLVWDMSYAFANTCVTNCQEYAKKYPREFSAWQLNRQNTNILRDKARKECAVAAAADFDRCVSIKMGN